MKYLRILATLAMLLSFFVVLLGAYTRLTDAGLGCPDWPGCYGQMLVPHTAHAQNLAQKQYPINPLETQKAWTEMVHRYFAGTLALLILMMNICVWRYRHTGSPRGLLLFLLGLVVAQAALGMWTVTFKLLPIVVMGHLLGGILIFGGLVCLNAQLYFSKPVIARSWRKSLGLAVFLVFCQIALGGWVSSNYAGLACIGFPQCNGQWLPKMHWQESFRLWSPIGMNYQGGLLSMADRVTIQMAHRMGAVVILFYLLVIAARLLRSLRNQTGRIVVVMMLCCVLIQCALGIGNVLYLLPLWVAVAHNGMAALLFATVLCLYFFTHVGGRNDRNI